MLRYFRILASLGFTILFLFFTISCATYYEKTQEFQEFVNKGEIEKANHWLHEQKKMENGKNRLLYLFGNGWTNWMLSNYDVSNESLNAADLMIEDQQKNLALEGLALVTNPSVKPYKPEDFEIVFVNYFKALNYIGLGKYDDALVECRRMNIRLYELNDKYKDRKNRYSDDAFAHVLIGLIYDATNDPNNAFIAYRNAFDAYNKIYLENFNTPAPDQLKLDLMRTAKEMGFNKELREYEELFKMQYKELNSDGGDLVFIWQNGFGPVKAEWSINLSIAEGQGGIVTFSNEDMGFSFPFFMGDLSAREQSSFSDLSFIRVAFPKYVERKPFFSNGKIVTGDNEVTLQVAEDINAIAFKTLQDRMIRELGSSLLRFAVKRSLEEAARQKDQDLGTVVSIINAITEKADTRNWQTLPNTISYHRIHLPEGKHNLKFVMESENGSKPHEFDVEITKGQTTFYTFQSIESYPISD